MSLTNDAADPVATYLISPDGDLLGYGQNYLNGTPGTTVTAYTLNPAQGTWTLIVDFAEPIVGDELSQSYSGDIEFNAASASAPGLPDSSSVELAAGTPVTVPVTLTNNGAQAEDFFIDARLNSTEAITLAGFTPLTGVSLPMVSFFPQWFVPTETSGISVAETSSLPTMFDFSPYPGDPDLASSSLGTASLCSTSPSASYDPSGGAVPDGFWTAGPTECGPYAGPAPAGTFNIAMTAETKAFDPAVTASTGDIQLASVDPATPFAPIVLNPGESGTIDVTITPSGPSGTTVSGSLYVDDFLSSVPPYGQISTDELISLPYSYTIK